MKEKEKSKEIKGKHLLTPRIALDFYWERETKDLLESLDIVTARCEENVDKFQQADKKDKYLNGYRVDENSSPIMFPPSLHLVKQDTTDSYSVFDDLYTFKSFHLE